MNFIIAFFHKEQEELAFKNYIADGLKVLTENTGRGLNNRFADILVQMHKPKDKRSGAEIAADVIKRSGLVVRHD